MRSAPPAGSYRAAFRAGEFNAVAGTSLLSILGDSAAYLAVTVLVYERTASPLLSALTFAVAFVPYLFGGVLLSALVDRFRPRSLLVAVDLAGAGLVAVAAVPGLPIPVLFAGLFVIGALAPVRSGTASALVAEILPGETFLVGRSVQRICSQTGQVAGLGLGGVLVAGYGPRGALLADTVSFVLSAAITALAVRARPVRGGSAGRSLVTDSLAGVREVWSHPEVRRLLLLSWAVPFVAVAPEGLAAPAVAQSGGSPALVGLWMAAVPVGTVLGDLLMVWTVPVRYRQRVTVPLAAALTGLMLVFVTGPPLGPAIALLALAGAASAYGLGLDLTLRERTPPELLARMYTISSTGLMITQGLGFAAAGALAEILPAHQVIAVAGAAGLAAVLVLARQP